MKSQRCKSLWDDEKLHLFSNCTAKVEGTFFKNKDGNTAKPNDLKVMIANVSSGRDAISPSFFDKNSGKGKR